MTLFISTDSGILVNADAVSKIIPRKARTADPRRGIEADDLTHYTLVMRDAACDTHEARTYQVPLELLQKVIIPAAPGARALVVGYNTWSAEEPTADDVWSSWHPIIAWSIEAGSSGKGLEALFGVPILPEVPASNCIVFVEVAPDRLILRDDGDYEGVKAAEAKGLEEAQYAWKERQKLKATTPAPGKQEPSA